MIWSLYHDGLGVWEKWSRNERGDDPIHLRARDDVHHDLWVPKPRSTVRHTRNLLTPGSEDLLNTFGMALLRQVLKSIRPPFLEATSLAFGYEELVHRRHVLGVHRFGRYRDGVEAGLLMVRKHVVCPVYDQFPYEHDVRVILHDADRDSHAFHVHSVCDWFHHKHHVLVALHDADRDGDDFHVHGLRHHLHVQNLGHGFYVQSFVHNFHVREFGHKFQVQHLDILHGSLVVLKHRKGVQWLDLHDSSQARLQQRKGVQWLDIHDSSQARRLVGSRPWHQIQRTSVSEMRLQPWHQTQRTLVSEVRLLVG